MADRIASESRTLHIGAFQLEMNEFGHLQEACLNRISGMLDSSGPALSVKMMRENSMESRYLLSVHDNGITIRATENGIFPALSELQSLVSRNNNATYLSECSILAEARFHYRGVLADDARHFQGVEMLKELLEVMFRLRFNVLHWHLCDDQGFRLPLPGYPELSKGFIRPSSNTGGFLNNRPDNKPYEASYTEEEIQEILTFAEERGIKVIPEIDMPGHHSAILYCYPQFACGESGCMAPKEVPGRYGVLENTLCLGKKEAREFAKKLALDTAHFLKSDTIHIGFDEIRTDHMRNCPDCRKEVERKGLKDPSMLIPFFREEVRDFLQENGVNSMAWNDESAFIGPDSRMTVIHWRPETNRKAVKKANQGQMMVMSDFYHYYLDYPYCMTPLKKTYRYEPSLRGIRNSESVVGTECTLWSEHIGTPEKSRFNAYYRMAAVSMTAWHTDKPPYKVFLKELRQKEEYYFGRKLAIPDDLLDPPLWARIRRFWKCMKQDSYHEVEVWKTGV